MLYLKIHPDTLPKFVMAHRFATNESYTSGHRSFDLLEFVFIEEGNWQMSIDDFCEFTAYPGDFFISPPNLLHTCRTLPGDKCHICSSAVVLANFRYEILKEEDVLNYKHLYCLNVDTPIENDFLIIPFYFTPDKSFRTEEKFNSIIKEFNMQNYCSSMALCGLFFNFTSQLTRMCLESLENRENSYNPAINYLYTKKTIEYLNGNYTKPLDMKLLSEYVNLHQNYMCNIFKKTTNMTITGYLNKLRIEKAKELMFTTNCAINVICEKVGVENEQYFGKLFKKLEGISPKQYKSLRYKFAVTTQ